MTVVNHEGKIFSESEKFMDLDSLRLSVSKWQNIDRFSNTFMGKHEHED